jgi:hypothetical protein
MSYAPTPNPEQPDDTRVIGSDAVCSDGYRGEILADVIWAGLATPGVLELLICRFDGFLPDASCAENVKEVLLRQCGWRWLRLRAFLGRDLARAGNGHGEPPFSSPVPKGLSGAS